MLFANIYHYAGRGDSLGIIDLPAKKVGLVTSSRSHGYPFMSNPYHSPLHWAFLGANLCFLLVGMLRLPGQLFEDVVEYQRNLDMIVVVTGFRQLSVLGLTLHVKNSWQTMQHFSKARDLSG